MPKHPIVLSETDLRPLVEDPAQMDSLIDVLEHSTVRYAQGHTRERTFVDNTEEAASPNTVQFGFAADDGEVCGYQVFAEGSSGNDPTLPNARFITLLDRKTRQLIALVDYRSLSPLRVGASSGIGLRYLVPPTARVAGVLGSAQQARTQLQAIQRTAPGLERALVFSPSAAHREAFAAETSRWLGLPVTPVASAREAIVEADVLAVANNSGASIVDLDWVKPGAIVVSIGGSRMPENVVTAARIVVITRDRLATREPYATAIKAGTFAVADAAADLGELILNGAKPASSPQDKVVLELDRLHVWAVATAQWAYDWAVERGIGTPFTLS